MQLLDPSTITASFTESSNKLTNDSFNLLATLISEAPRVPVNPHAYAQEDHNLKRFWVYEGFRWSRMPRAGFTRAPGIDVELAQSDSIFIPGDTVSGTVIVDAANSLGGTQHYVHIKIYGRAKVLIVQSNGQGGRDYYRGRQVLFEKSVYSDGPPSLQSNKESWPFAVQIPTHTIPGEYKNSDKWKVNPKYLDNQEMDISQHPLPGVFYYCGDSGGTKGESYVEYVLEASLRDERTDLITEDKKKKKKEKDYPTTIIPLVVRARSTDRPINYRDYSQEESPEIRIKTLKLLPEFSSEDPGVGRSLKSVFQRSKVPQYFFDLKVNCPATLQLDNPSHVPFRLSVVPKKDPNGKGSLFDDGDSSKLPDVKISSFSLCLKMSAAMRARMMFKWDTYTEKHHEFAVSPDLPPGMVGYVIPRENAGVYRHPDETNTFGISANEPYLDVGQLLNLHISRTHSTRLDDQRTDFKTKRPLWPSFKTYNIALWYEWKYKIQVTCAGESHTVEGKQRVEIISQSEEQEQNIAYDGQGRRKKWGEMLEGAEGVVGVAALVAEIVAETTA